MYYTSVRNILLSVGLLSFGVRVTAQSNTPVTGLLEKGFVTPPDSVKPSVYWYWLCDNVSKEGVEKDIEAMAKVGIGRAFIGNIGLGKTETPYGTAKLYSDAWWQATEAAITKAHEKGISIGLFNSPGWSQSGGPWIKPSQSMRYITGVGLTVQGPKKIKQVIPVATPDFQDVGVLAFKIPTAEHEQIANRKTTVKAVGIANAEVLTDDRWVETARFREKDTTVSVEITMEEPFTARSLVLYPAQSPFQAQVLLQAREGDSYTTIKQFEFNRSNPSLNVGFVPFASVAVSFPAVTTNRFRLVFSKIRGQGELTEIKISAAPVVERYMEKQLAKMFQTPLPLWNEYQWPQAPEHDKSTVLNPADILNISSRLSKDGKLNWDAPAGEWMIIRYGMAPTGVTNAPATPEGAGLELDKINKAAMQHHFDSFVGKIQQRIPAAQRGALQWVVADSYETGSQNWTDGMATDFKAAFGYDPLKWLPVLSGRVVGSMDQSNRFLWDLRRFIADRVSYHYVGGLREVSNKHGLKLWLENYGHWGFPGEFLQYGGQADEVSGEFWNEGDLGSIENRDASSAAHIYGKARASAESFTAGGLTYQRYPALLKKRGDWSFTEGINHTLLHVMIEQPYEDKKPGINAWFGTEFNRNNTWFYQGKAFIDYLRRCNYLLQQGKPVSDVAYFIGEDAPKMTGTRNPPLPAGYQFDYINAEVILNRLHVKDGYWVLPDGVRYKLLVLPPLETMRPALLQKISEGVKAGGVLLGPAPKRAPGLQNYPAADKAVERLAADLWHAGNVGKGKVLQHKTMQEALDLLQTPPDFSSDQGTDVLYTHRHTDTAEIYFITNQTDKTIQFSPAFRVTGAQPAWWDAVTGYTRMLPEYTAEGMTTRVPLKLEAYQSGFVIFRKGQRAAAAGKNFPELRLLQTLNKPWTVRFDTAMRGPVAPVVFEQLTDWSLHPNDSIKYYSGAAVYTTSFTTGDIPSGKRLLLDVGTAKVMAVVKVNGREAGTAWTAPWQVDITDFVKPGENKLEIEVVNTWVNRLIGDSKLPESQRKTWANVNPYKPDSPLEVSGLLGPVRLLRSEW
jgi:hypothetical protein